MAPSHVLREAIQQRAYLLWHARGCPLWDSESDWFVAETEVRADLPTPSSRAARKRRGGTEMAIADVKTGRVGVGAARF